MDLADSAIMKRNDEREVVKEIWEHIAESEIIDLVDDDQEAPKKRRKVTFSKEYSKCNEIIDEVLRVLQNITGIDIATTPRSQLERIIKILLATCIDQYSQMQDTQTTMGAMAELIEEFMDRGEENEKIRQNELKLKTHTINLEKKLEHLYSHNENLNKFIMLGPKQKDELDKLKDVEEKLREKVAVYKETYAYSQTRKQRINELNETKAEWLELSNKKEELEVNWEKEKTKYEN